MLLHESKKTLIKQKGYVLIIVFVFIKIATMFVTDSITGSSFNTGDEKHFSEYLKQYEGRLTTEKMNEIEKIYKDMSAVNSKIDQLYMQYNSHQISEEKYISEMEYCRALINETQAIKIFYSKCVYADEKPSERYVIDDRGWIALLTKERFDFILFVLMLIIVASVFCTEYESDMIPILLTSMIGRRRLAGIKILLGVTICGFLTLVFEAVGYFYRSIIYGLQFGNAPLQSLEFFSESTISLTLAQAYGIVVLIKLIGAVFVALLTMLISTLVKNTLIAIASTGAIVIFPALISSIIKFKYALPLPTGLFYSVGYIWPDLYQTAFNDDISDFETTKIYTAWTSNALILYSSLIIVLLFLIRFLIIKKYLGKAVFTRFSHSHKKVTAIFLLLIAAVLSGCSGNGGDSDILFDNSKSRSKFCVSGKYILINDNKIANTVTLLDFESGKSDNIIRDPFLLNDFDYYIDAYLCENSIYYSRNDEGGFKIFRVDLADFSEKQVYSNVPENKVIAKSAEMLSELETDISDLCVTKNNYYFRSSDSVLYKIDRKHGTTEKIDHAISNIYVNQQANTLWYINALNRVCVYDENAGIVTELKEINLGDMQSYGSNASFFVSDNNCYYSNPLDDNKIYCYSLSEDKVRKILNQRNIIDFTANSKEGFFIDADDGRKLKKINFATNIVTELLDESCVEASVAENGEKIVVSISRPDNVTKLIDTGGTLITIF